jgi:hypothetical protein
MSLTNSSLPIQTVSNTSSNYFVTVQNFTQGQTDKETVSSSLLWKNNNLLIDSEKVKFLPTINVFTTFTTSGTPPRNAKPDDTWYDTASDIIFRYIDDGDGTFQWVDVSGLSNFGNSIPTPPTKELYYLVVGGGGGGGQAGGTIGGAGGGGGGGVVRGLITGITPDTPFGISVGTGGPGGTVSPQRGSNGVPSTLSSPILVSTITAVGGGGGGRGTGPLCMSGNSGGSGGGSPAGAAGSSTQSSQNLGNPTVLQQYGNVGGTNTPGSSSNGVGGGGALSAGSLGGGPGIGGGGGLGYTYPFNGVTYGAGGSANPVVWSSPAAGTPGSPGTGGGGMSASGFPTSGPAGNGAQGTIILAMPTPNYPGSAPGATVTTPPAAPGMTLVLYLSPATFTY